MGRFISASSLRNLLWNWGGWIRTNEWQDQNLLSYHLTTPQ